MHTHNSTQHTPTPWQLCKVGPFIETVADGQGMNIIAQCEDIDGDRSRGEDMANAAFIVRACNAHYELVAALEAVANCSTYLPTQGDDLVFALGGLRDIARAALAKAKGGA